MEAPGPTSTESAAPKRPSLLLGAVHLAVLWAFAFQQPLLDLLGDNADFFVVRGNLRGDIVSFALVLTFVPPLAMLGLEWVVQRIKRELYEPLHLTLVGVLGAAIVLQFLKDNVFSGPAGLLIVLALALGGVLAYAYSRAGFATQALSVLSPAPVLFLVIFLFFTPVHKLILPQEAPKIGSVKVPSTTPVVELITDEFPLASMLDAKGQIDASRFPNFAALSKESTWYRNTTTVSSFTTRAVPAILTGKDPGSKLPIASDQPKSIFTMLGGSYKMNTDETATAICPAKLCGGKDIKAAGGAVEQERESNGKYRTRMHDLASDLSVVSEHLLLPDGIAEHLPAVDQTFGGFRKGGGESGGSGQGSGGTDKGSTGNANQIQVGETIRKGAFDHRPRRFERWVASIKGKPSTFNFLHVELPHYPWIYQPDTKRYEPKNPDMPLIDGNWPKSEYYVRWGQQRHLLQAMTTDTLLGQLIKRMKKVGLWDKAIFVVTADHGGSFIPGQPRRDPDEATLGEIAPVPLFVRAPGQDKGETTDEHRCTTDIVPMISKLLGFKEDPFPTQPCEDTVSVAKYNGSQISLPLDQVLKERDESVKRRLATFPGPGLAPLYRFGPDPQLVGKAAASVPAAPSGGAHAKLLNGSFYDPKGETVPVVIQASLTGVKPGEPLAVAVNGQIETTAEAVQILGETRLAAMVPQSSVHPGANTVRVYRIAGSGRALRLQPL